MKLIALILPILILLASGIVSAAIIEGTIYDIELNMLNNAQIEVDTTPKQHFVSKDGMYSFNVPVGEYTLTARHAEGIAEEKIRIADNGRYNIDLILLPDFSEEEEILDESDLEIEPGYLENGKSYAVYYFAGILIALIIIIAAIWYYKKRLETNIKKEIKELKETKKEEKNHIEPDLKELVDFIKKEGGRTTQKDIRKHFPQSEAKISLMIAELEHDCKIKKIKKGRGNIIVLR